MPKQTAAARTLARELGRYSQTKSSLHFPADEPLPTTLVRRLIKARIEEIKTRS